MSKKTPRQIKQDVEWLLPNVRLRRIFDVGANVGQTVVGMHALYPDAELLAFEPVRASYERLEQTAADLAGVQCFNLALGEADVEGQVTARGTATGNRVVPTATKGTQAVTIATGDAFCRERGIDHIDYLKVDTEGHELQVLRGFARMLAEFRIDLVELEAGMSWDNQKHTPFERLKGYLEPMGYLVFRFYEQVAEKRGHPQLRRVNVVFVSRPTIERNVRVSPSA